MIHNIGSIRLKILLIVMLFGNISPAQIPDTVGQYAHKVVVREIIQTKNYTYLQVLEQIDGKDSLQWLALPYFQPKIGDVYYFENGMQMGKFHSNELNRTFDDILFLANLGTNPDKADKNIVPSETPVVATKADTTPAEIHTVVVKEVLQTSSYTYLRVKEGEQEDWLALVKVNAAPGQVYTYDDAATMYDFHSKELNRTFKEIKFLSKLTPVNATGNFAAPTVNTNLNSASSAIVNIETLYKNKNDFNGKRIRVKGEVTRFSSDIMHKNWIHLRDGTNFNGQADLAITTNEIVTTGDMITLEGIIDLNKDYGSGYSFEVIMEDAKIIRE